MLAEAVVPVSKGVLDMTARSGFLFTTIAAVSFLTIAATSSVVLAQQGPVAACAADIQAKCAGYPGLEGRAACIKTRYKDFSLPCQLAQVKARAVGKACRADVKKSCAGIKPGGGRIETCIKDHFADMSDACKEMISQAGGGKS
jgi:Cysteine rich repeat